MTVTFAFSVASGTLELSRGELVVLAEEVGAHRVRALDGSGLLHAGIDVNAARHLLARRTLDAAHADFLGSEAAWVRRALGSLRVSRPGDRAVLVLRHAATALRSTLAGVTDQEGCAITGIYDRPVSLGPVSTVAESGFVVEDLAPSSLACRIWAAVGLNSACVDCAPPAHEASLMSRSALARLRHADETAVDAEEELARTGLDRKLVTALARDMAAGTVELTSVRGWWRDSREEHTAAMQWLAGTATRWLFESGVDPDVVGLAPVTDEQLARLLRTTLADVLR